MPTMETGTNLPQARPRARRPRANTMGIVFSSQYRSNWDKTSSKPPKNRVFNKAQKLGHNADSTEITDIYLLTESFPN